MIRQVVEIILIVEICFHIEIILEKIVERLSLFCGLFGFAHKWLSI